MISSYIFMDITKWGRLCAMIPSYIFMTSRCEVGSVQWRHTSLWRHDVRQALCGDTLHLYDVTMWGRLCAVTSYIFMTSRCEAGSVRWRHTSLWPSRCEVAAPCSDVIHLYGRRDVQWLAVVLGISPVALCDLSCSIRDPICCILFYWCCCCCFYCILLSLSGNSGSLIWVNVTAAARATLPSPKSACWVFPFSVIHRALTWTTASLVRVRDHSNISTYRNRTRVGIKTRI